MTKEILRALIKFNTATTIISLLLTVMTEEGEKVLADDIHKVIMKGLSGTTSVDILAD